MLFTAEAQRAQRKNKLKLWGLCASAVRPKIRRPLNAETNKAA